MRSLLAVLLLTLSAPISAADHKSAEMKADLFPVEGTKWQAGPPSLPKGAMIAVLEGDPSKEGPFVFRVKLPDGYKVPAHTHPKTERVTVISGTFNIGMGDTFDEKKTTAMPAGTYGQWEAGMKHFVWIRGETIVQFHGIGPWSIQYVNPADDPRNDKEEWRKKDESKSSARGKIESTEDTLETVKKNIAEGKAVLVDVRSQEEWNRGHIDGAIFLPVQSLQKHSLDIAKVEKTLPKKGEKILYTFCVVGMRAKQAAFILGEQGYTVRPLKPGYNELIQAGFGKK